MIDKKNGSEKRILWDSQSGWLWDDVRFCFYIFLLFYILPAVVIWIINLSRLVIFGTMTFGEFLDNWKIFSFYKVNNFYLLIWNWARSLFMSIIETLKSSKYIN